VTTCVFCRIVAGEIPAPRILENEHVLAFRDINPQAPVHVLVAPKLHVTRLDALNDVALEAALLSACRAVAADQKIAATGYRVVINTGSDGGQSVDHLHFHVLGGRAMHWPPG
jgi:histidine triad (HIT) family protein